MIPRVEAPRGRPLAPLTLLLVLVVLVVGACDLVTSATPGPTASAGPTTAIGTPCPGTTADPNATPWNGGTAAPGTTAGRPSPCPSIAPTLPAGTTAAGSPEPSGSDEPGDSAEPSPSDDEPSGSPEPTFLIHVVKAGENLTSIALRYKTHPRSVAYWNRDSYPSLDFESPTYKPDHVEVGWRLRILPGVILADPLPTRRPSARPSVSIPPPPSVAAGEPAVVISNGPRGTNAVALTFDMGGEVAPALDILNYLIDNDIRATIFPTGEIGETDAVGIEAMELIASKPDLFAIGNHSYEHPNFTELGPDEIADQLKLTEDMVVAATGRSSKPFFRPPFGAQNAEVRQAVADAGWPMS